MFSEGNWGCVPRWLYSWPWPPRRVSAQVGFQFGPIVAARDDVTERHDMADRFQISVLYVQVAADGAGMRERT